jgi:hypothetical protein
LVWLIFPTAYRFLMISPNLHEIWVFFFLNLSQELKLVLLLYFGTLGDGYSLKGSKDSLRGTLVLICTGKGILSCWNMLSTKNFKLYCEQHKLLHVYLLASSFDKHHLTYKYAEVGNR